jgi:hypothetical protein
MWNRQSGGFIDDPAGAGRLGYPAGEVAPAPPSG